MKAAAMAATVATGAGGTILCSQRFRYCSNCNYLLSLNGPTTLGTKSSIFTIKEPLIAGKNRSKLRLGTIIKAADSTQPTTTIDKSVVPDDGGFSLAKV